jgi:arabinosaccharide transport system permease protein
VGLPKELMDSARIDGATEYGIFFKIMLPLMAPSMAAMAILQGLGSWNNFLWPLIVLRSNDMFTLPIGLATLLTPYGNNYDILIAGSVMTIVPIIILFIFFQRYFVAGLTVGGVKG